MTRVCVYGAGAIGGYLAVSLARAGADVSVVTRGPHVATIRARGLSLRKDGADTTCAVHATDDPASLGAQDYVIIGMKAHSVPGVVHSIVTLLGPDTAVVPAVNGLP